MKSALIEAAQALGDVLKASGLHIVTAESCTAGLVSQSLGAATHSAQFFSTGIVTYTDEAKHRVLKVSKETLAVHTAVSEATVREMARGACSLSQEQVSLAITGYAGPDGGEDGTPAGTIWFAWQLPGQAVISSVRRFTGEPEEVIEEAARLAMTLCRQHLLTAKG